MLLISLLKACAEMKALVLGEEVHDFIINKNMESDIYLKNALISMYMKCGKPQKALEVWKNMHSQPNTITYISIVTAVANIGEKETMWKVYDSVVKSAAKQDIVLQTAIINMLVKCEQPKQAFLEWKQLSTIHPALPSPAYVSVLTAYANIDDIKFGHQVNNHIQSSGACPHALKVHHSLMQMYTKCGAPDQVYGIWQQLCKNDIKQNYITFACALSVCATAAALPWGQKVYNYINAHETISELVVQTALLDMYAKSGKLNQAVDVFLLICIC